eukprot:GHVS01049764.1.p1 GENE.GHVS01049764.1~~GHVS01049764.1.p1  ORF type:complete len:487 (+),score=92.90 GHVS01049764.1:80-1540(+)
MDMSRDDDEIVEVEYIPRGFETEEQGSLEQEQLQHFKDVFSKFQFVAPEEGEDDQSDSAFDVLAGSMKSVGDKAKIEAADDSDDDEEEERNAISRKHKRLLARPSLAALKTWCRRPEVVEVWDCTASDPRTLVWLKSYRNSIGVPPHWSQKRKYMQGKRGIDKQAFKLPEHIEATKIGEIRSALQAKEAAKSLKQKQRDKARPKMHRMDIDYEVLHDAFFKYATKPRLTKFGDIYYEGKENELRMRRYKIGLLTMRLKEALGMADCSPPPWLINMQRYGPPPSYPTVKIAGLNAPIPAGAQYGYQPGGWGKPPVDEYGRPLYGDFTLDSREEAEILDVKLWGELREVEEEEEFEEEFDEEEHPMEEEGTTAAVDGTKTPLNILSAGGFDTPAGMLDGMASVSSLAGGSSVYSGGLETPVVGATSVFSGGLETPNVMDIRNRGVDSTTPKPYHVLTQQKAPEQAGALFQSNVIYKIPPKTNNNSSAS